MRHHIFHVLILPHEFSQDRGEITPTMKIKRKIIQEHYKEQIDAMYEVD